MPAGLYASERWGVRDPQSYTFLVRANTPPPVAGFLAAPGVPPQLEKLLWGRRHRKFLGFFFAVLPANCLGKILGGKWPLADPPPRDHTSFEDPPGGGHFPLSKNHSLTFEKPLTHSDTPPGGGSAKSHFPPKKFQGKKVKIQGIFQAKP